jgi:hypothetical protein
VPGCKVLRLMYSAMLEKFSNVFERRVRESWDRKDAGLPCRGRVQDYPRGTGKEKTRRDLAEHRPGVGSRM